MMRRTVTVIARTNVFKQARAIHVDRPDLTNKHSIVDHNDKHPHLKGILAGNLKWVEQMKSDDAEFFDKLAQPQKPRYLYFGCSDSRVPANEILGLK